VEYDVILTDIVSGLWTYKRDARITRPATSMFWHRDGLTYLKPEVQLLYKAPGLRPQDQQDLDACLPRLDPASSSWLRAALEVAHPGHPWIDRLL
jgi:hypothetical protein